MENVAIVPVGATSVTGGSPDCELPVSQVSDDWQLARAARVNLLVIHRNNAVDDLLESLELDLYEPIARWRPGQPLVLPPVGRPGSVILQEVGGLARAEQQRLLDWLELTRGEGQVISTTRDPLLPRVQSGVFLDTLYYRLNTVCVDAAVR